MYSGAAILHIMLLYRLGPSGCECGCFRRVGLIPSLRRVIDMFFATKIFDTAMSFEFSDSAGNSPPIMGDLIIVIEEMRVHCNVRKQKTFIISNK